MSPRVYRGGYIINNEKIFGLTKEELRKQLRKRGDSYYVDPQSKDLPIKPGETIEPCIRGAEKILKDPDLRKMMRRIYRGESKT